MLKSIARGAGVACCLIASTTVVQAQKSYAPDQWWDDRFYVAPFGKYTFADGDRQSSDGWGWGLSLGKAMSPGWDLELRYSFENLDRPGGAWHNQTLGLDAKWYFMGRTGLKRWENTVQPYGLIGAGTIKDDTGTSSKYSPMVNAGLGVAYPIQRWGRLFIDGRYRWDDNRRDLVSSGNFSDWIVSFGIQIPLGTAPAVAQPVRAEPPPPAPAPPPPVAKPEAKPPPPPKKPVTKTFTLSADAMFDFDSARLTPVGQNRLDNMITEARQAGIASVSSMTIVGHTDPLGPDAYNQKLSEQRAAAVRDYLVSKGMSSSVIQTEGRGKTQPKVTEADCKAKGEAKSRQALIKCLAPDRRVEISATGTTTSTE